MLRVLRQVVGDREPRRLGADKDMLRRSNGWIVEQRPHRNVNEGAGSNHRVKQRAAHFAVRVVTLLVAEDHEVGVAAGQGQLFAFDAGEWLESRAGRSPAVGAMAVGGV